MRTWDFRHSSDRPRKNRFIPEILRSLTVLYLIWTGASLLVLRVGRVAGLKPENAAFTDPVAVIFFLCLAASGIALFMVRVNPLLAHRDRLRKTLLLITAGVSISLFGVARYAETRHNLIAVFNTANLLIFANLLGTWIVTPLKRPAEIIPLCLVAALTDIFSVAGGPTRRIADTISRYYESGMKGPVPASDFILIKIAVPGIDRVVPLFGLSDWVIIAFLTACAAKFGLNDNLAGKAVDRMIAVNRPFFYLPVAVVGLITVILSARYLGIFLPALPVIAVFFVLWIMLKYPEVRQLTRSDRNLVLVISVVMGSLAAVWHLMR